MADTEKLQATLSSTAQLEGRVQNQTTLIGTAAVPYAVGGGGDSSGGSSGVFTIDFSMDLDGAPVAPNKTYAETVAAFEAGQVINLRARIDVGDYEMFVMPILFSFSPHEEATLLAQGFAFMAQVGEGNVMVFVFMPDNMIHTLNAEQSAG